MGQEGAAYIYPEGYPEEALIFRFYPDKLSLGGGTEISRRSIPGFARQVTAPKNRKSVDEKLSMVFADVFSPRAGQEAPLLPVTSEALEWVLRHLGPGEEDSGWGDDDDNVFVLRTRVKPQLVLVESWGAELQALRQDSAEGGNLVVRMRVDLTCVHHHNFSVNTSVLSGLGAILKRKKKPKAKKTESKKDEIKRTAVAFGQAAALEWLARINKPVSSRVSISKEQTPFSQTSINKQ